MRKKVAKPSSKVATKAKTNAKVSKQATVLKLLARPAGVTIAKVVAATGWQPHTVRGFLAGVVRKRLNLALTSEIVGSNRVYRTTTKPAAKP